MTPRVVVLLLLLALVARPARADEPAKALFDQATGQFALHHYAEAATAYEKSFALRPDPAILYNAAQAHRLAGNNVRALDLYQSLLRLYGTHLHNRPEIAEHIRKLKLAVEADGRAANGQPTTPQLHPTAELPPDGPSPSTPPVVTTPVPAAAVTPTVTVAVDDRPVTQRRWFWPVIGSAIGVVVIGAVVGIAVGTSKTVPPNATFGVDRGN